jgi:hypothetical protein
LGAAALCVIWCFSWAQAQKPKPAPKVEKPLGAISGAATADDGQPLPELSISVTSVRVASDRLSFTPKPKPDGKFRADGLPPGLYRVTASAPGYVQLTDENAPDGYRPGATANLRLTRGGALTGAVTEEDGSPAVAVSVRAVRLRDERGQPVREGYSRNDMTDDRGVYRIWGLAAGVYVVATGTLPDWTLVAPDGMPPFYYPNGPAETAQAIELANGQEVTGLDMRRRRAAGHKLSGTIGGAVGKDARNLNIYLLQAKTGGLEREIDVAQRDGAHVFVAEDVPDGEYELIALRYDRERPAEAAPQRVTVRGEDVTGLAFDLLESAQIMGRVVVEKNEALKNKPECAPPARALVEEIGLRWLRAEKKPPPASPFSYVKDAPLELPDEDGNFKAPAVRAGFYRLTASLPVPQWFVRAATLPGAPPKDAGRGGFAIANGAQIKDVTVLVSDGAASLSGRVAPAREGVALPENLAVYLVPAEKEAADDVLRYSFAPRTRDGLFSFNNLAPGRYWLAVEATDGPRPAFWDADARLQLRRRAEAARRAVTLNPCQRAEGYKLAYEPPR